MTLRLGRPRQLDLEFRQWGGRRKNAGRKPAADRTGFVAHLTRPSHATSNPVHITMRAKARSPNLRAERIFRAVRGCLVRAPKRGMRVIHFSVQRDHVHFIVEAGDRRQLARGVQGLASGIARAVNGEARRRGSLWRDRYHRRDLTSPRQVRNALVYVLMNFRKHGVSDVVRSFSALDSRSSAIWFAGWIARAGPALDTLRQSPFISELARGQCPVRRPTTWLLHTGWRRHGLVQPHEAPLRPG